MSTTAAVLGICYVIVLCLTIAIDASWGIYLYVLHYFLNPAIRWWYHGLPSLRYSLIIAIFILIAFFIRYERYRKNRVLDAPQAIWIGWLAVLMGLLYYAAVWPEKHLELLTEYLKVLMLVGLLYKVIDTPIKFNRLIWTFLGGNFYLGWVARATGRTAYGRLEDIGPADGKESNPTAAVLITAVPILLFYLVRGRRWQRILALVFLFYIIDGIVLINSRGAFIGLLGGLAYLSYRVMFSNIKDFRTKASLAAGIVFGFAMFIALTDDIFWGRMLTLREVSAGGGGSARIIFWVKGLELFLEHPLGVGGHGYMFLSPQFIPAEMLATGKGVRVAHSTVIQVLTEFGIFGILLFFGYVHASFRLMGKARKIFVSNESYDLYYLSAALLSAYCANLVTALFLDSFYAEFMLWLPAFIASFYNIFIHRGYRYETGLFEDKE